MGDFLTSLAELCHLPLRGGFNELDVQINKLRKLRDSYRAPPATPRHDRIARLKKSGDRLCQQ